MLDPKLIVNTNNKARLIGIILAGGKGTRLDGKGKLNHKFNNNTLLEHVYERIKSQFSYIAVNVNNKETAVKLNLEVIYDKFSKNIGPLAGIHASLSQGNNINGEEGYVCKCVIHFAYRGCLATRVRRGA